MSNQALSAPTRVIAVALNPALDYTLEVNHLHPGEVNRALRMQIDVGGKAINVASCLADFGIASAVTGQLGRENAFQFEALFSLKAISNQFFYLDGLTRINTKLVDLAKGETTDINMPGPTLAPGDIDGLMQGLLARLDSLVGKDCWVVLAGSLPPGWPVETYQTLIKQVHGLGGRVVLDASGAPLASGLAAAPDIVKPNRAELAELVGHDLGDIHSVIDAAHDLLAGAHAPQTVIVSMGGDGALFMNREETWLAHPAKVDLLSTVGAGDAMVAGIVAARLAAMTLADSARLATAFSAAKLARLGPHLPAAEAVRALADSIQISSHF